MTAWEDCLPIDRKFDLELTLYPSFNYALLSKTRRNSFAVACGRLKGAEFRVKGDRVCYRGVSPRRASELAGLWYDPEEKARKLSRKYRRVFYEVFEHYESIGLSINTVDRNLIFVASFLSRNTDFHRNVVRWMKFLCECGLSESCFIKAIETFRSYQLVQLPEAYKRFSKIEKKVANVREILSIKNVGVKVLTAFLLFSSRIGVWFAPPDVNYFAMVKRLGFLERPVMPVKRLCAIYLAWKCRECPLNTKCLVGWTSTNFKQTAGWLQTVLYIHSKKFCRRRLCDSCPFKKTCQSRAVSE